MQSIREVPDWILYCPTVFDWSIPDSTVDLDAYAEALLDRLETDDYGFVLRTPSLTK